MEEISSIFNNAELTRAYEPKLYILIYCERLKIAEWKQVEEKLHKCLSSWKGKLVSLDGSLVLINLVLTNMMPYLISFLMLQKEVLHKLDYFRFKFFSQVDNEKNKYRLGK
jgi:hypothetical protein